MINDRYLSGVPRRGSLIMMHRGQIIHDFQGDEKRRLRPDDLLARFEEVRRAEQLDESAALMLPERYV